MERKLYRSNKNIMISGVCAGIGEYFNVDPTVIRLLWLVATILLGFGTVGVISYIACICIIPVDPGYIDTDYTEKHD